MTLNQWLSDNLDFLLRHDVVDTPNGGIIIYATENDPGFNDLWHLSDYRVESRGGITVRLAPITVE